MASTAPRGIQATLLDYFKDTEYFDLQEANELLLEHQQRDINAESIRARIYEGIDKGLFERVGKGLYTVTRKDEQGRENTCLLINGDGRDLSMFPDNSIDALVTDHPYSLKNSLKGGNRNFADYELFRYDENDFKEKNRVLKPGHFCVEFLPEENADNYQYLYQIKEMAHKAGLEYYSKVPWRKSGFVANTGRKSMDTEDVVFFSKGRARDLRPDAKKDKAYAASREIVEFKEHIPGSVTVHYSDMGGIATSEQNEVSAIDVDLRISVDKNDAARAKSLMESAWYNAVENSFEDSPLDEDHGGEYTWEELDAMPVQEYILKYLEKVDLEFVDLSPGPEDIFKASTDVIVNPTNLIGPMGAGLAKAFRDRYPGLEEIYKESCRQRKVSGADGVKSFSVGGDEILSGKSRAMLEGNLFFFAAADGTNSPHVLCFPTKRDWKDPSSLELIESGLQTFVQNYKKYNIKSITFPKLGCGLGGLDWETQVKPLMAKYLSNLPDLEVQICGDTLREDKKEFFMSGAAGMLPTVFDVAPPSKKDRIHQAEKPVELLEQILRFITKEDELVLDQFAGSGVLGEAALNTGRNSILIEKDEETFQKLANRLHALDNIQSLTPAAEAFIALGKDALVAQAAFERTGDRDIPYNFAKSHTIEPSVLYDGEKDLKRNNPLSAEQQDVLSEAIKAVEDIHLRSEDLDLTQDTKSHPKSSEKTLGGESPERKTLECSSRGDRRFSALFAKVTIKGKEKSIEEWYQEAKRTADGKKAGKGKPFDYIVDPFSGVTLPPNDAADLYRGLWVTYLNKNPDLVEYAKSFDEFSNAFKGNGLDNNPAEIIEAYVKGDRDRYVASVKASHWYQNMTKKLKPLSAKIADANQRQAAFQSVKGEAVQMSFSDIRTQNVRRPY